MGLRCHWSWGKPGRVAFEQRCKKSKGVCQLLREEASESRNQRKGPRQEQARVAGRPAYLGGSQEEGGKGQGSDHVPPCSKAGVYC